MFQQGIHPSDQDLLLLADGELSSQRAAQIQNHLSACWTCRTRMAELERSIADFIHLYRAEFEGRLLPIDGPRALLRARLAASAPPPRVRHLHLIAVVASLLLLTGVGIGILRNRNLTGNLAAVRVVPDGELTPGATERATVQDVCTAAISNNDPEVPDPLKREVLKEYGLTNVSNDAYEIDYLVTPQLGGAPNIRNLWPEPSLHTVWNARVKDALEDRLHYLVCSGQLDLATAQHDLSHDWVAAYKKYFRTDQPLQTKSSSHALRIRTPFEHFLSTLAAPEFQVVPLGAIWRPGPNF